MEVTAESHDTFLAFRRLLYSLSRQLTAKDKHGIIFIHFYKEKVSLETAGTLELLCKIESQGIATYNNPNGLLELMKDLKRNDLAGEVKEFMKKKSRAEKKATLQEKKKSSILSEEESDQEDNLELRATLEASLVQATVLLQQMEKLQVCTSGKCLRWSDIDNLVVEASQTSEALAERLRKAEAIGDRPSDGDRGTSEKSKPAVDALGYINAVHSDRHISNLLSSSVPLSAFYNTNNSQKSGSLPTVSEIPSGTPEWAAAEEDDEDDYEPMNPGVVSAATNITKWQELKPPSEERRDYQIPRPHNVKTAADTRPIQYTDVILSPRTNGGRPSLVSSPVHSTDNVTEVLSPPEVVERRSRVSSTQASNAAATSAAATAAAKVAASKRWTRLPSEEETPLPRQPIAAARQKWAKPQTMEARHNSNQLNNNWPRAYAKTEPIIEVTSASTLSGKYPSTSAIVTIPVSSPPPEGSHQFRKQSDDNYTTLHRTEQLSEPGYKTVKPRTLAASLPQLSSLDGSHFYKPLERKTVDMEQGE